MNKFQAALLPFARYYRRLTDGRRGYPKIGILHSFDEGCPTEATITVEDLKLAHDLAQSPDTATVTVTGEQLRQMNIQFNRLRRRNLNHNPKCPYVLSLPA